ncbi:MAG: hypothetical protein J6J18_05310 [Oscillospiraceae bacterium]|nr:hypothetical protein [Oscillospiraceae bacterium]
MERVIRDRNFYKKIPSCLKWLGTMFITLICWQFFRCEQVGQAFKWLGMMFGFVRADQIGYTWQYYFDAQMITFMIVGVIGSTVLGSERIKQIYNKFSQSALGCMVQEIILLLLLFVLAIMFMVNSTYSPFIYFQY